MIDAITSPKELIQTANDLGYSGLSITEHESISSAVQMLNELKTLKEKGKIKDDVKVLLGNEAYVVDDLESVREGYVPRETKFPHQILVAKNRKGFEGLSKLSSMAWSQSYFTGAMERTPITKAQLKEVVTSEEYKNTIFATSTCLGSSVNLHLQKLMEEPNNIIHYDNAFKEVEWYVEVFGTDNYFIELQPAMTDVQIFVNKQLVKIGEALGLKNIVANDTHFARPEDRDIHKAFLNSKEGDREVDEFYYYCYMHSPKEIYTSMSEYLGKEIVEEAISNTSLLYDMCEDYTLDHSPIIPKIQIPEFEVKHLFEPAYDKYQYIAEMAHSSVKDNQYLMYLIEEGFLKEINHKDLSQEYFHKVLDRINREFKELIGISEKLNDNMSSYYLSCRELVNIIWDDSECGGDSLVGSGRGSGAGFLVNFLLGITQINPLDYVNMPLERHATAERPSIADIDIDVEGGKRQRIISALKANFGEDRVLQVATYGTEGSKSAIKTAARGHGVPDTEAQYIASLIPSERGQQWSLSDCIYGTTDKDRKPMSQLINELEKYPKLLETALKIEGIIVRRGIHAGGIIIFNEDIYKHNAMMTASKGDAQVTQFNLSDSEQTGGVKYDLLSVENLDRMRATLDTLEQEGEINYEKGLRQTFTDLLHPKNLDLEDKTYFEMASTGQVPDLFQFQTQIGVETLKQVQPQTFEEFCAANSLMRLQATDGGEQPIDIFIRHKNDMNIWYQEMKDFGLNEDEIEIMKDHLEVHKGVNTTQEVSMAISADPRITNFSILEQNMLRKTIAKPKGAALEELEELHYSKGEKQGARRVLLEYVWEKCYKLQFSYSFSQLHTTAYSIIGIQNLELNRKFDPVYWQTASLNVDSGTLDGDNNDYAKIGTAIGKMQAQGVKVSLPSINKSNLIFTPDAKNKTTLYGLGAIKNINNNIANQIISLRPYESLLDVLNRLYDNKIITNTHLISLVKSGALDEFGERKTVMMEVIKYITPLKNSYTLASVAKLLESGVLDDRPELPLIELRESFKNKVLRKITSNGAKTPHKVFKVTQMSEYDKYVSDENTIISVQGDYYEVDEKAFKKYFDKETKELKEWLKTSEAVDQVNRYDLNQQWIKYALGTYSSWEMETLNYYHHEHELAHVDYDKYGLVHFGELQPEATVERYNKWNDRQIPIYKTHQVSGVVLGTNKTRHTVTLLDPDGSVFDVKYQGGAFSHYDKTISEMKNGKKKRIESSWFTRGNKLVVHGFRRGSQFVAKTYKHSITQHTTKLITDIEPSGDLYYQVERYS